MLEDSKSALLESAKKTLMEESNFDTDQTIAPWGFDTLYVVG